MEKLLLIVISASAGALLASAFTFFSVTKAIFFIYGPHQNPYTMQEDYEACVASLKDVGMEGGDCLFVPYPVSSEALK